MSSSSINKSLLYLILITLFLIYIKGNIIYKELLQLNEEIKTKHSHIYLNKQVIINICILHIYVCVFCNLFTIYILS